MAGTIAVGESTPPIRKPIAVRTRPPTKNCQPASNTPSCSREKIPIRQVERAPATVEARIKPLAVERKAKGSVRARKVDECDTGKPQHAAEHLGRIELFGAKRQSGKENRQEVSAGLDDGTRHGTGVREAQVEKEILADGLEERQDEDGLNIASLRNERMALGDAHANNDQRAGKGETQTREEQLRCAIVCRDAEERVADLDAGKSRPPRVRSNEAAQDESGQGGEIRLAAFP